MEIEKNKIHVMDCCAGMGEMLSHSVSLIIADPPYYKVKGDFDKAWGCDFDSYLADCEKWADEMERVLSYNGTLIWYGDYRRIAYMQTMLDKRFELLANCVIEKRNSVQNTFASISDARTYFPNEERFLVYASKSEEIGEGETAMAKNKYRHAIGMARTRTLKPLVDYFRDALINSGLTTGDVNRSLKTCMASHWFTSASQWELPTSSNYDRIRALFKEHGNEDLKREYEDLKREYEDLKREYEDLKREYEDLKREYEDLRRPFRMEKRQSDIFRITSRGATDVAKYGHATPKNLNMTKDLIKACSREGDTVLVPFAGSGTECVAARQLKRDFVAFELDPNYAANAMRRIDMEGRQMELFL